MTQRPKTEAGRCQGACRRKSGSSVNVKRDFE